MRSAFIECPQKFYWEYMQHFKGRNESIHLHAGKVWANALETTRMAYYGEGRPELPSIGLGINALIEGYGDFVPPQFGSGASKSLDRLLEAFAYYWTAFPLATDPVQPYRGTNGKPMVEFSFALPLGPDCLHPSGEPILYSGRADMIATYAGAVSVYDDKTTTALGDQWAKQWNLRAQFTGYTWAARAYGIPVQQIVVRGIAILKTQIKHAESLVSRSPAMIDFWHGQIIRDINRAKALWEEGYWDRNLSDGCSAFGGCMFQQPCLSNNPDPWLETGFIRRAWNPVTREETLVTPLPQETESFDG